MIKLIHLLLLASLSACWANAMADERKEVEELRSTTYELIKLLVDEGVLSKAKADSLIREAEKRASDARTAAGRSSQGAVAAAGAGAAAASAGTVRVPYVPESVRIEIRDEIKQEIIAQSKAEGWGNPGFAPDWLSRIAFDGDLRLRYQADMYPSGNAPAPFFQVIGQNVTNTEQDRERLRLRARLGVQLKIDDWLSGGLRLTTGNTTDPVSTNQTLGNSLNKNTVVLDRAYLKADPLEWLTVYGGRMPNPWFSTDLVWDEDLNFDGIALLFKPRLNVNTRPFLTLGAFPLQEVEDSQTTRAQDKWLLGAQAGVEWSLGQDSRFKVGAAYYEYRNYAGIPNTANSQLFNLTAPIFRQKGNSVFNIDNDGNPATTLYALAPNYRNINLTASYDYARFDPVHVVITGDYVRNTGFDQAEILKRTGLSLDRQDTGYMGRIMVGMPSLQGRGDWQVSGGYRYLERDAVVDAFTDSDFHLGGTNNKGFFLGGSYGITRNSWMTARWMSSTEITGLPLSIDVFQLDFNARF